MSEESRFTPINDAAELLDVLQPSEKPVVIKCWATWCAPCKQMAPRLETLAGEYPGVDFRSLDAGEHTALAKAHGVSSVPTLIVRRAAGEKISFTGPMAANQLQAWLKANAA